MLNMEIFLHRFSNPTHIVCIFRKIHLFRLEFAQFDIYLAEDFDPAQIECHFLFFRIELMMRL